MYIGQNSIHCLKAFLEGWYLRNPEDVIDLYIMEKFEEWVELKYNVDSSISWSDILLENSKNETEALNLFFKEFDECINLIEKNFDD